jgi:hypothetical protein
MDVWTTYANHSELQLITALSLISTIKKYVAHFKSSQSPLDLSWQQFLTIQILQLPAIRSSCQSRPCRTQLRSQLNSIALVVFFITSRRGPHRKSLSYIIACVFFSAGMYLPCCCSETAVCLFVYCIATTILVVRFEVFANQKVLYVTILFRLDNAQCM